MMNAGKDTIFIGKGIKTESVTVGKIISLTAWGLCGRRKEVFWGFRKLGRCAVILTGRNPGFCCKIKNTDWKIKNGEKNIMMDLGERMNQVRKVNPLVHHITNYVTVNDCANACLAVGASPVMADAIEEAADMAGISSALVINIGTLNAEKIQSMLAAGRRANEKGIPVILDPVGCGATPFRNRMASMLLQEIRFSVIRGNASEILSLAGKAGVHTKGVDNGVEEKGREDLETARYLSQKSGAVVVISGKIDRITDGERNCLIRNGSPLLPRITGSGCMCTSLIGAFCGANPSFVYESAAAAMALMGVAGEIAEKKEGSNIGRFHMSLFDALGNMDGMTLERKAEYEEL